MWSVIGSSVAKCEEVVCDFFKQEITNSAISSRSKKIHTLIQKNYPLDFVLCEGSLKMDILKYGGFLDKEIEYFQKTKIGAKSFCQCAEFFMNAFKLGQEVRAHEGTFLGEKYFIPISKKYAVLKPQKKSTVFYPSSYKELYSLEGDFAKVMSSIFSVSGQFDKDSQVDQHTT